MLYRFEGFELDDEIFALRRDGADVPLRPQALDVLLFLLRNRERVVTKREILDVLWHGAAVSENTLPQAVLAARRALDDDGADPRIIQTVRARGYRFVAPVDSSAPSPATAPPPSRTFVGREDVLRRLEAVVKKSVGGRGGIALLVGDAGAGKTWTMDELRRRAQSSGVVVLEARCHAEEGAPDLWPWIQLLRASAEVSRGAGRDASELVAELSAARAGAPEPAADAQGRFVAFDRVVQVLRRAAQQDPLLLILDDIQHADAASLLLLNLAVTSTSDARIAIVAAYRDAALASEPVLARTVGAITRSDPARRIVLEKLSRDEVVELAGQLIGMPPDDALLTRVLEKTDGNPMLVVQMLHAVQIEGARRPTSDGSTSALLAVTEMREAIGIHLEVVSAGTREVLRSASVLGAELTLGRLAALRGVTPQSLLTHLDEAVAVKVLSKARSGAYRFIHVLVRDVLYRSLGAAERAELHEKAGATALASEDAEDAVCHFERAVRELDLRAAAGQAPEDDAGARARALQAVLEGARPG